MQPSLTGTESVATSAVEESKAQKADVEIEEVKQEPKYKDEKVRSQKSLERKNQKRQARAIMRLEKGSSLEKEERSEMRKLRSSFLQDLLTQELDERKNLLNKKAEL